MKSVFLFGLTPIVYVSIDYFKLKDVTIIGISLGGYLAPRAAAFDKITQDMQDKCEEIL